MEKIRKHITVFEHQSIRVNQIIEGIAFDQHKLIAFQEYYGQNGVPFYSLIHNGIQFNEYVGVIQVGNTLIEVLPKADKNENDETKWRNILIGMLRAVGSFDIKTTSNSNLKIKPNTILDLYFELFIKEVEYLYHSGLVKKYRKTEGNSTALKGNLMFGKHLQQNLTHQERFYVSHTTYDTAHLLHFILYKAIKLLKHINTNIGLQSRIGSLLLNFPEMPDIKVTETTFNNIVYNRKTKHYQKAIEIARLLLLQYHPDVKTGRNHVLALMFDMNLLWEKFVYMSLRKHFSAGEIRAQSSKPYWKLDGYRPVHLKPDIVISRGDQTFVIDTKWKMPEGNIPADTDLKQMFAYNEYWQGIHAILLYPDNIPADEPAFISGSFANRGGGARQHKCSTMKVSVLDNNGLLYRQIGKRIFDSLENNKIL